MCLSKDVHLHVLFAVAVTVSVVDCLSKLGILIQSVIYTEQV